MVEQPGTSGTSTTKSIVADSSEKINDKIVNNDDVQFSDKNTESVYDLMGETERLAKEKS